MMDFITDFVEQLVAAAEFDSRVLVMRHEGPSARYITRGVNCCCPNCTNEVVAHDGMYVRIDRRARLLVEPVADVVAKPLGYVVWKWVGAC